MLKQNENHNDLTVPFEKTKTLSFASSIMKHCWTFALSRFPVKLICCIAFVLACSFCCLLKSIPINLQYFLK